MKNNVKIFISLLMLSMVEVRGVLGLLLPECGSPGSSAQTPEAVQQTEVLGADLSQIMGDPVLGANLSQLSSVSEPVTHTLLDDSGPNPAQPERYTRETRNKTIETLMQKARSLSEGNPELQKVLSDLALKVTESMSGEELAISQCLRVQTGLAGQIRQNEKNLAQSRDLAETASKAIQESQKALDELRAEKIKNFELEQKIARLQRENDDLNRRLRLQSAPSSLEDPLFNPLFAVPLPEPLEPEVEFDFPNPFQPISFE